MRLLLNTFIILVTIGGSLFADTVNKDVDPMAASAATAKEWLQLVDQGRYADSWAAASLRMQLVMPKNEWVKYLNSSRHPLGSVQSRVLATQRPAENPKGLAPGAYMVILYQTTFSQRPKGEELVTLSLGPDGKWRILTYMVK